MHVPVCTTVIYYYYFFPQNASSNELYDKICDQYNFKKQFVRLSFGGSMIPQSDDETLEDCGLYSNATITFLYQVSGGSSKLSQGRKIGSGIRLTTKKCMIAFDDTDPTMELPCGHVIAPLSLADYIKDQVKSQKTELRCPACSTNWKLSQIKDMGLENNEKEMMEVGLTRNLIFNKHDCKECPQCGCIIEKLNEGIRVKCYLCTNFEFCWNCMKKWKKPGNGYKECGNTGCDPHRSDLLQLLLTCNETKMKYSEVVVPAVRACPACGEGINHISGCKHMLCPTCSIEFCFVCLSLRDTATKKWPAACGGYGTACKVAPRQTSLPSKKN